MEAAIWAEGLTRRFGDKVAVNHLDLRVEQGEVFGFLGSNGAGKTTTVRLLNGVLSISEGRAMVLGHDVASEPLSVRRRTGVLTEAPNLYEELTARENLVFAGDVYGVPEASLPARVGAVLEEFGLAARADDPVGAFSKGMKQRLAIARALLHEPDLLFLDEPTSGLDPEAARMVTQLISELSHRAGRTVFLCTHNLDEAQRLCDRVAVINEGMLQAVGSPDELAHQLWQRLQVEIDLRGDLAAVGDLLAHLPFVHTWQEEQGLLVIELDHEEQIPDLVSALAGAGKRIYGVVPRRHTLSEIYFRIQAEGRRNAGGAA